jgi:hypothetical protein
MIAGDGKRHHGADRGLALHGYNAIGDAAHGKNRSLRRRDDGAELIHLIHAKVADRKCGIGNIRRPQLPSPRALGNVPPLNRYFSQTRSMSMVNHGGDYSIMDRNGDPHIHLIVQANGLRAPTCVQSWVFQQNAGHEGHQQIRMRDPNLA